MFDKFFEVGTWAVGALAIGQIIGIIFTIVAAIIVLSWLLKSFFRE